MYEITGGSPVSGEITCNGTKNFVTKAIVASLLADGTTTITNVPAIGDVDITLEMVSSIGASVDFDRKTGVLKINPETINTSEVQTPDSGRNRIPILLLSPLLHRFGKASVPALGGCDIGARKVDFHSAAIEHFGASIRQEKRGFFASVESKITGAKIDLPYPSVGATETCLMMGVLAKGTTVITGAAIEPEIHELITMLRSMGGIIFIEPDRKIIIEGVEKLYPTKIHAFGDRIEAASWACLACASDGSIVVKGFRPDTLANFLPHFQKVGGGFEVLDQYSVRFFRREKKLRATMIETDVYPGFSTDWQQPFAILLSQAEGMSVIHETVYEKRFGYLKELAVLGLKAELTTYDLGKPSRFANMGFEISAIINGPTPLHSVDRLDVPDLRAGLAYVIAAAIAQGTTKLGKIENIERGYGDLSERTKGLSLNLKKIT
ncbi:MAG: UDP-N-acetylglucosamine 1-carboxyvinyltransferase [Patescibacteria group bacterium]